MPDQDGIAFIRELRSIDKTYNLHIIVLSVMAQTGRTLLNGDAVSVIDWLDKPIDFNKLLMAINQVKTLKSVKMPRILHIEDNNDTQQVVCTLLEGHALVATANSLEEATNLLDKEKYDLIILDLILPDGNSSEILPLLAKHRVPILVFSNTELNSASAKYVSQTLMKSNSSNELLLNTIKGFL